MDRYYFDNAASTQPYKEVIGAYSSFAYDTYANPSALHEFGNSVNKACIYAKKQLLDCLELTDREVIFTSGATESTNLAITGIVDNATNSDNVHIVTTEFEHSCILEVVNKHINRGVDATVIKVGKYGKIDIDTLISAIKPTTRLVSITWVSNENGIINDIDSIAVQVKKVNKNTLVHVDAVQGIGKVKPNFKNIDMISLSAHKFHGLKGIGALVMKKNVPLKPVILGGGQQSGYRSGTVNAPMIYSLGVTCEIINSKTNENKLYKLQSYLYSSLANKFTELNINTQIFEDNFAPHILSLTIKGIKSEVIIHILESFNIYVSASSACSTHHKNKSALKALNFTKEQIDGTIRISISEFTTYEQIDFMTEKLYEAINRFQGIRKK